MQNKTISTIEAARILGVTSARVQQVILYEGNPLKAEKVGRDWRIPPRAVAEYQRLREPARIAK
jgi:excisionase family DNA binding protein